MKEISSSDNMVLVDDNFSLLKSHLITLLEDITPQIYRQPKGK